MKQTNNAIKFLMAQYRAIYQSAYFKGLASAIVVTATLASAQAQAAALSNFDGLTNDQIINVPSDKESVKITSETSNDTASFTVKIASAQAVDNKVEGVAASAKKATFEINGADTKFKVAASTGGSAAGSLTIGTLDVKKGTVTVEANGSNNASLSADSIKVGEGGTIVVSGTASATATLGTATTSEYNLSKGSTITLGLKGSMVGKSLISDGGKIVISGGSLETPTYYQDSETQTPQKLDIDVTSGGSIKLANSGDALGVLDIASGSILDVQAVATGTNELKIIDNGKKGSVVILQDGVTLKSSVSGGNNVGGVISVSGAAGTGGALPSKSELHLTAKTLGEFLAPTDTTANTAGSVLLKDNSTLKLTNDSSVDIAADSTKSDGTALKISCGTNSTAGQVVLAAESTIEGKKLTISKALATDLASKLNVVADELTLGSTETHNTATLNAKSLSAKNVKFLDSGTFVLADDINLSNLVEDSTDPAKMIAQDGTIEGPVIISVGKKINIDGGKYTSNGDLTISGGKIEVHNTKNADTSSLVAQNGTIILDLAATDGKISASGSNTLIDLSNVTVQYKVQDPATTTYNVTLEAKSGGELKLKGEDVGTLLGDGTKSGSVFDIGSGSTLNVTGDLTLQSGSLIKSTAAAGSQKAEIVLSGGAKMIVAGELGIQKFDKTNGLNLGDPTTRLQVGTLSLNLADTDVSGSSAILKSGNYVVTSGLSSNAEKGVVLSGSDVKFEFGGLSKDSNDKYTALSSAGSSDVEILASGASVDVNSGVWKLNQKLTLDNSSKLTVGNKDTVLTADNSTITASLDSADLVIKSSSVDVEKTGTLNLNKLDANNSKINVSGTMSLAGGSYDANGADGYAKHGIKLGDDAIILHEGSKLILNGTGLESALDAEMSGDKVTGFNIDTQSFNASGSLVSKAGSTVDITYFKDGTVLTKEALKALSSGLFGTDPSKLQGSINLGKVVFDGLQSSNGTVSWTDAKDYGENYLPHYKNDDLMGAQLTNINGDTVYGHWGSVLDESKSSGKVSFADNASLNKAKEIDGKKYFALGKNGAVLGLDIKSGGTLTLANGGIAGDVSIGQKGNLIIDSKDGFTTELEIISGDKTTQVNLSSGITQVNKSVNVGYMSSSAESTLNVTGNLTLSNTEEKNTSIFKGAVNVTKDKNGQNGNVLLSSTTVFAGATTIEGNLTSKKDVTFSNQTTIEGAANLSGVATVQDGGFLKAKDIVLSNKDTALYIGRETVKSGSGDKTEYESSTGYLEADFVKLSGGTLFIDPDYGKATTIAAIKRFGDKPTSTDKDLVDVGTVDGNLIIGKNSALLASPDGSVELMKEFIARYQDASRTSLSQATGSILYVSDKLSIDSGKRLILDAESRQDAIETELKKSGDGKYAAAYNGASTKTNADLFMGKGSLLVVGQDTLDQGSGIYFKKSDASILAEEGSKVVLDGDRFISSRDIVIFQDSGNDGVKILGEAGKNDIVVESINGIMGFTMKAGQTTSGGNLELLKDKIDTAYLGASNPTRNYLIGYASLTKNWQEYYGNTDENSDTSIKPGVNRDYFVNGMANENIAVVDNNGKITVKDSNYKASEFVAVKQEDGTYQVFFKAHNDFLEKVVRDTNGLAADQAARMGVFGGAADAALLVGNASYEAVAGRFGMGQQGMLMTYANNGQGGAMWLAPVYKSRDTTGFDAQGIDYGADTSITGLVLGGDVTFENGMRYGVMANIGQGNSSGSLAADGVSSDLDYYSFGVFVGYTYQAFSMVADLNYSIVDSDVKANTQAGQVNSSFDTTNLSLGVTGQVNLSYRGLDIVPHVAARFSKIEMDDYSMDGAGKIGDVNTSSANVFSVPVGVTISKEYFSEEWSFQPSVDFNVTANFGDDSIDGDVNWSGISNANLSTSTQFNDDFTYGVIFGFGAQSERISIGAGLGYQGSSNMDEFTLTGTARYTF